MGNKIPEMGGRGTLGAKSGTGLQGEIQGGPDPTTMRALSELAGLKPSGFGEAGRRTRDWGRSVQSPSKGGSGIHPLLRLTPGGLRGGFGLGSLGFLAGGGPGAAAAIAGGMAAKGVAKRLRAPIGRAAEKLGASMLADNGQTLARFAEAMGVPPELREVARSALRHGQRGPSAYRAGVYVFLKSPEYRRWDAEQSE